MADISDIIPSWYFQWTSVVVAVHIKNKKNIIENENNQFKKYSKFIIWYYNNIMIIEKYTDEFINTYITL